MTATRTGSVALHATLAFAVLTGVSSLSLAAAWFGASTLALIFAAGLAAVLVAPLLARSQLTPLTVAAPRDATFVAGRSNALPLEVTRTRAGISRDLVLAVGDGRRGGPTGHVPSLRGGEPARVEVVARFPERGRRSAVDVTLESGFPFGLFVGRTRVRLPIELLVLPRLGRLGPLERRLRARLGAPQGTPRSARGDGEFHALREWREGESVHGVAWRPSARRGRLLLRETTGEDWPALSVVLGCRVSPGPRPDRRHPSFERAVSLAATVVEHFLRHGRRVSLTLAGPEPRVLGPAAGRGDLLGMLAALAEVQPLEGDPRSALTCATPRPGQAVVVVVAARGALRAGAPGDVLVLDVDDESGLEAFEGMQPVPVGARA